MPAGFLRFRLNTFNFSRPSRGEQTTEGFFTFHSGQGLPGRLAGLLDGRGDFWRALLLRHGSSLPSRPLPPGGRGAAAAAAVAAAAAAITRQTRTTAPTPAPRAPLGTPYSGCRWQAPSQLLQRACEKATGASDESLLLLLLSSCSVSLTGNRCLQEGCRYKRKFKLSFLFSCPLNLDGQRVSLNSPDQFRSLGSRPRKCARDTLNRI